MAWFSSQPKENGLQVSVELPVTLIQERDTVIAYTPALDLSTFGKNNEEAKRMFSEAVKIFFNDLVENNTIDEVLSGLGWTKNSTKTSWVPPKISQESVDVRVPVMA
jgi:hypothetical protein